MGAPVGAVPPVQRAGRQPPVGAGREWAGARRCNPPRSPAALAGLAWGFPPRRPGRVRACPRWACDGPGRAGRGASGMAGGEGITRKGITWPAWTGAREGYTHRPAARPACPASLPSLLSLPILPGLAGPGRPDQALPGRVWRPCLRWWLFCRGRLIGSGAWSKRWRASHGWETGLLFVRNLRGIAKPFDKLRSFAAVFSQCCASVCPSARFPAGRSGMFCPCGRVWAEFLPCPRDWHATCLYSRRARHGVGREQGRAGHVIEYTVYIPSLRGGSRFLRGGLRSALALAMRFVARGYRVFLNGSDGSARCW